MNQARAAYNHAVGELALAKQRVADLEAEVRYLKEVMDEKEKALRAGTLKHQLHEVK